MSIQSVENERNYEIEMSPELKTVMMLAEQAGEVLKKYHQTSLMFNTNEMNSTQYLSLTGNQMHYCALA